MKMDIFKQNNGFPNGKRQFEYFCSTDKHRICSAALVGLGLRYAYTSGRKDYYSDGISLYVAYKSRGIK